MSPFRAGLLALILAATSACAAELKLLKGEPVKGEVVSISETEIVIDTGKKKVTTPVNQVLLLNMKDQPDKIDPKTPFVEVELTDGSQLRCAKVELKGKEARLVTLRYFAGLTIEQAAEALGISRVTAHRYWTFARAWLHQQMAGGGPV